MATRQTGLSALRPSQVPRRYRVRVSTAAFISYAQTARTWSFTGRWAR